MEATRVLGHCLQHCWRRSDRRHGPQRSALTGQTVSVSKVQFVLTGGTFNKSVLGTATPTLYGYLYSWNTATVPNGIYTLQSLATDEAGNTAYSAGVTVTVDN